MARKKPNNALRIARLRAEEFKRKEKLGERPTVKESRTKKKAPRKIKLTRSLGPRVLKPKFKKKVKSKVRGSR